MTQSLRWKGFSGIYSHCQIPDFVKRLLIEYHKYIQFQASFNQENRRRRRGTDFYKNAL